MCVLKKFSQSALATLRASQGGCGNLSVAARSAALTVWPWWASTKQNLSQNRRSAHHWKRLNEPEKTGHATPPNLQHGRAAAHSCTSPEPSELSIAAQAWGLAMSRKEDMGAQSRTSLIELGITPYCGRGCCGCSSFSLCSFFALGFRLAWLAGLFPRPAPGIFTTYLGSGFGSFSSRTT